MFLLNFLHSCSLEMTLNCVACVMENRLVTPFYLLLLLAITCDPCTILFVCINKTKLCISYAFLFKLDIMCVDVCGN